MSIEGRYSGRIQDARYQQLLYKRSRWRARYLDVYFPSLSNVTYTLSGGDVDYAFSLVPVAVNYAFGAATLPSVISVVPPSVGYSVSNASLTTQGTIRTLAGDEAGNSRVLAGDETGNLRKVAFA